MRNSTSYQILAKGLYFQNILVVVVVLVVFMGNTHFHLLFRNAFGF